jgi:G3E family GTPase
VPAGGQIPISVLTGFLGSGKTTVLNHLVRQPALSAALVIVNEFGEIGIDHDLIESTDEETVLLQSGCLCCTIRNDLIDTLRSALRKRGRGEIPAFDRVVIETTGLADPAPILQTLMTDATLTTHYRLDGVVATVDAVAGSATLDRYVEAVKQAAMADRLILTKTDLAEPDERSAIE